MLGTRLPRSEGRAKEVARHRPHHGHAVRYVQHGGAAREGGGGGKKRTSPEVRDVQQMSVSTDLSYTREDLFQ